MTRTIIAAALALACAGAEDFNIGSVLYKSYGPKESDNVRLGEMTTDAVCAEIANALNEAPLVDTATFKCQFN